ncbi:MAG: hypothetical protein CME65_12305 [Halobacteriovoraceae bacterium]|nr:hypothetical protein [Halobacteriovoraceae bacterium]|tara:strand:+ start:16084 stop:17181 length:1098 start_codon:yes stop_codon:yes gene_type:complete
MDQIYLSKLQITNFRNLSSQILEFNNNINCIFGENGNGKTNLLEGIYFLLNRKSFRKKTGFPQIISVESEQPEILFSSVFNQEGEYIPYTGKVQVDNYQWYFSNQPVKRKKIIESLFIGPTDSFSFHSTPAFRRTWFDHHLGLLSPEYKKTLTNYNNSLRFRNSLLAKKPAQFKEQLMANEVNFCELICQLNQLRSNVLNQLTDFLGHTFKLLFDESHNLVLKLDSKFNHKSPQDIQKILLENLEKDIVLGHSKNGAHRDDYLFEFDGYNSFEYCSLGQQKMSFLSLIFAYTELFRYKFKTYPMVLLDDVSGELDKRRWKNLIGYLQAKKFQVFITTANESFKLELEQLEGAKKIFVSDGNMEIR